ncbi:hypothetical protein ES332_A08G122400v1 [Gossypium tomentosum]|uniref:Uncharacterized protein n=1 Tax=Gossypium tomentosum TaxID=34277 RepID=A0A5D2PE98_GOSTO|nr:hypothetical protein ES332_A08G122400v1 [Gossypium tomentosum]
MVRVRTGVVRRLCWRTRAVDVELVVVQSEAGGCTAPGGVAWLRRMGKNPRVLKL